MNKRGPNTEPWGTPAETGNKPEDWDLNKKCLKSEQNKYVL